MNHMCFSLLMVTAVASLAQPRFEGTIESKNTTIDEWGNLQHFTMTMFAKGDKLRIENSSIGGQPGSIMIYRSDMKVVWMLNDEDKTYLEIRQEQPPVVVHPPAGEVMKQPSVQRTEKKKDVLGYPCERVVVSGDGMETEIWATKSLGQIYSIISRVVGADNEPGGGEWENTMIKMGYFPLISTSKLDGKVVESQEVTGIHKKSLDDHLFELPEGYRKQAVDRGDRE